MALKTAKTMLIMAKTTNKASTERIPAPTKRALETIVPPSNTDVNGSYTGKPKNPWETPVQDADDL